MPRRDGTGPFGMGRMAGRRAGRYGADAGISQYGSMGLGRGFRGGRAAGNGFRWRNWFRATGLPGWMRSGGNSMEGSLSGRTNEENDLRFRAEMLQAELESIRQRLDEIEASSVAG